MARSATVERSAGNGPVSEAVVSAVAEATGSDPLSLEPLYDVIDPDALDALFETDQLGSDRSPTRLEFTYCDCDVVVSGDGEVRASKSNREAPRRELSKTG